MSPLGFAGECRMHQEFEGSHSPGTTPLEGIVLMIYHIHPVEPELEEIEQAQ